MTAGVGIRLIHLHDQGTRVETFVYPNRMQRGGPQEFVVRGTLGCTAISNLGFLLLKIVQPPVSRYLGVLMLLDRVRLVERLRADFAVADDEIMRACRDQGCDLVRINAGESDCDQYLECRNQAGTRCDPERAQCRKKR